MNLYADKTQIAYAYLDIDQMFFSYHHTPEVGDNFLIKAKLVLLCC